MAKGVAKAHALAGSALTGARAAARSPSEAAPPLHAAKQKRKAGGEAERGGKLPKKSKPAASAVGGEGALHPFEHDPADDCETCFAAYQDIAPFLAKLAHRLGKAKTELCIWDPYYCAGKVKQHLRKLGYTNVVNENKDFYALTPAEHPPFDVLLTSPPYSRDHIQRCIQFAVSSGRPWFILQPQYVHRKAYFSDLVAGLDPFYMVPGREYVYYAHHGGRKDNTTVECRHWAREGKCPMGDKCLFSHGTAQVSSATAPTALDKQLVPVTPFKSIWHIHFGTESGVGKKKGNGVTLNDKMFTWSLQKV